MRSSPLLEYSSTVLIICLWIGAITALFAATTGLFQNDIKAIIAYSTCSQLGMLFIAVGLSLYNLSLFHVMTHAFFKALLFLGSGAVIHAMSEEQDIRKYGGLAYFLPFTYTIILIGSFSLMAMPFLSGYYSKDLIIESAYGQYLFSGFVVYWLATISAVFTSLYSIKLIYFTFISLPNASLCKYNTHSSLHEPPLGMGIPLIILAIMSIGFGYVFKDLLVGLGSPALSHSLFVHPSHLTSIETEFGVNCFYKILPLILTFLASLGALSFYHLKFKFNISPPSVIEPITGYNRIDNFLRKYFYTPWNKEDSDLFSIFIPFLRVLSNNIGSLTSSIIEQRHISLKGGVNNLNYQSHHQVNKMNKKVSILYRLRLGLISILPSSFFMTNMFIITTISIYKFFNQKYWIDLLISHFITFKTLAYGYITANSIDREALEFLGPLGLSNIVTNCGKLISSMDTTLITHYALYITLFLIFFIIISYGIFGLIVNINLIFVLSFGILVISDLYYTEGAGA